MTVAELIEKLKEMPQNYSVFICDADEEKYIDAFIKNVRICNHTNTVEIITSQF